MEHNRELELAWEYVEHTGISIFLTGKAGTGKTTFLRTLRQKSAKAMIVVAPTGVAAINAGGATIHSFFQLPLSPYVPGSEYRDKFNFSRDKLRIIRALDLLVIDEISMVRADLLDAIDNALRKYRRNPAPFGGVQLLMIGDLQQLAPVVTPADEALLRPHYATNYFRIEGTGPDPLRYHRPAESLQATEPAVHRTAQQRSQQHTAAGRLIIAQLPSFTRIHPAPRQRFHPPHHP